MVSNNNSIDDEFQHAWAMLELANIQIRLQDGAVSGTNAVIDTPQWLPLSSQQQRQDDTSTSYQIIKQPSFYVEDDLPISFPSNYEQTLKWDEQRNMFDASEWYVHSNCGLPTTTTSHSSLQPSLLSSSLSNKRRRHQRHSLPDITAVTAASTTSRSAIEPKSLKRIQLRLRGSVDAKENLLNEEINSLQTLLRQKDPTLADVHITDCTTLYRQISLCLEHHKCKKNKRKVAAAATYYTLKRHFNPNPKEIERIFDLDHKAVTDALKRVKHLAFRNPVEFGWLFAQERGETVTSNVFVCFYF